jgi:hypothetical protein
VITLCATILKLEYHEDKVDLEPAENSKNKNRVFSEKSLPNLTHLADDSLSVPQNDFMISLIKYKAASILLTMVSHAEPDDYIFYVYRRVIDPDVFRLNFAYHSYFIDKFHNNEYDTNLFF